MTLSLDIALALCALSPFIAAALMPVIHRAFPGAAGLLAALVPAATFLFLLQYLGPVAAGEQVFGRLGWGSIAGLTLSFRLDGLSMTFALAISGIGAFILAYSGKYLSGHEHKGRFLSFMLMFMGAMQGLVLSDNMVALYVFWELTSVTSFLLIGFDGARQAARRAAVQALVVTGAGGLALLAGAILLERIGGSWDISALGDLTTHGAYLAVLTFILLAAFTKSAQFPFQFWLPNAMEAPTPVSAYLHSATMVQAGVYLLARFSPVLGGTDTWTMLLVSFGAVTLLWGAVSALRQTDLKQMLAQTTVASLGLLVLLIGIGSEIAVIGAMVYFVAHALYKAALFLIAGVIDHETGTRELTALGGLRKKLPLTFAATVLAAASMIGLPPLFGYIAKEEMYLALPLEGWQPVLTLLVLIIGNGLLSAIALAVLIRPFTGALKPTPIAPHEAPLSMIGGPLLFGVIALVAGILPGWFGSLFVLPAAAAIAGEATHGLKFVVDPLSMIFWLSVATWAVGGLAYWKLDAMRAGLRRVEGWSFDKGFDAFMFGLIRMSAAITRFFHHGKLELYLLVVFVMFALAAALPLLSLGGLPGWPELPPLDFYEWSVVVLALVGVTMVVVARNRLFAVLALGIQGISVALVFMLFGAPDLSFTQFMVEILSVVILALVMTRLNLDEVDARRPREVLIDGGIALLVGLSVTAVLFTVLEGQLDTRLSDFFNANSQPIAHGRNIVNVILVDFRGVDTLGEIAVVMTAGIAILALVRSAWRRTP